MKNKNKVINLLNEIAYKELGITRKPRAKYNIKLISNRDNQVHELTHASKSALIKLQKSKVYKVLEYHLIP